MMVDMVAVEKMEQQIEELKNTMRQALIGQVKTFTDKHGGSELARRAGVSPMTVSRVFHYPNEVPNDTLKQLAKVASVS
jgi:DNA-binding MurR/RpiR family transcriptional regulator